MKRRDLLQAMLASALSTGAFPRSRRRALPGLETRDRYGGSTARNFRATGFFRVEKDDRWWFVTPEGNAFLSFGINHLYPDLWQQPYNRDAWQKKLGIADMQWNSFQPALRKWFLKTCKDYGFNTVGVHTALQICNRPEPAMPYMQPIRFVDIPHWKKDVPDENFVDVFSQQFASHCDALAKKTAAPLRDDPWLLGYSMTDCPLLTEEDCRERPDVIGGARRKARVGWPRRLRNLAADAPGKKAWVSLMQRLYHDQVGNFNETYGTTFDSFDALAWATNWRPQTDLSNANERRDNLVFLKEVVRQYYQTARDAIERYDPNHLFFGDKLNANTDTMDVVLRVTSEFTDVILYQMYARFEVQEPGLNRWSKIVDKPIVNGDSAFTLITENMPRPYGPVADSRQQRAQWAAEFFLRAFARPEFTGWHYCGLIDATQLVGRKQDRQHSGILDGFGEPYPELKRLLKGCADDLYGIASGSR